MGKEGCFLGKRNLGSMSSRTGLSLCEQAKRTLEAPSSPYTEIPPVCFGSVVPPPWPRLKTARSLLWFHRFQQITFDACFRITRKTFGWELKIMGLSESREQTSLISK